MLRTIAALSSCVFLTRPTISLDEVLNQRTPEEDEIKHLHLIQVSPESLRAFVLNHHGNISATGEPNLLLYGKWGFGQSWFIDIM